MPDAPCRALLLAICTASAVACPPSPKADPTPSGLAEPYAQTATDRATPAPPGVRASRLPVAATRESIILAFNAERERAGVSPLRSDPSLERVAQARAEAIAARGRLPGEAEAQRTFGTVQRRLVKEGYTPHGWMESVVVSDGDAQSVMSYWRGDPSFPEALRADYSDLGLGMAKLGDTPLYLLLAAWPEQEVYAREVRGLADLSVVRAQMIAGVNRLRSEAGAAPLTENPKLDAAAQEHAEDMLARGYYDHESPEGKKVGDRLTAEGYAWRLAAENLAAGHVTVDSVLDAWMQSSGHRANLLRPNVTDFGFGLAVGPFDNRYRVLWVQTFASPISEAER